MYSFSSLSFDMFLFVCNNKILTTVDYLIRFDPYIREYGLRPGSQPASSQLFQVRDFLENLKISESHGNDDLNI